MVLSDPLATIATSRDASRPTTSAMMPVPVVRPICAQNQTETSEPSMKTSPWAKLISSMIP